MNTRELQHCPHAGAGDNPCSRAGGHQHHAARTELANHAMGKSGACKANLDQIARSDFLGLLDSRRNFNRLSVTHADTTAAIADHHKSPKAETATTLHNGSTSRNSDDVFLQATIVTAAGTKRTRLRALLLISVAAATLIALAATSAAFSAAAIALTTGATTRAAAASSASATLL